MPIRRKTFPCGHVGLGRFCHACARASLTAPEPSVGQCKKDVDCECLGADLRVLPRAGLRSRAHAAIVGIIIDKQPYRVFGGKRLTYNRAIISIPIGRDWRLLLLESADKRKTVLSLISHEAYNQRKPGAEAAKSRYR